MCTWIVQTAKLSGSGKTASGWMPVTKANVCYDHPAHAFMEHSLNIDFVNEDAGPDARVAVEISAESAQELVNAILAALEEGSKEHGGPVGRCARVACAFAGTTRGAALRGLVGLLRSRFPRSRE